MDPDQKTRAAWVRPRARRRWAQLAGVAAAVVVLAGCGSSSGSSDSGGGSGAGSSGGTSGGATKVTIGYAAPVADQMLPSVTAAAGIFKKYGIDAKVTFLQQSSLEPALISGSVQFGVIGAPGPEVAAINGSPLQYVAQWQNSLDVIMVAGKKYPTVKSLDGTTTSISSSGAFSDFLAQLAEQKYGISLHEVPLGNLPNQITAFAKGSVASVPDISPFQLSTVQKQMPGTHTVLDWRTVKNLPGQGLVADQKYLQSHKPTAIKVLKALSAGLKYFKTHPKQSTAVIAKETEESPAVAKQAYQDAVKTFTPTIVPKLVAQQNVLKDLAPKTPAAKGFDATKLQDDSYAKAALGGS